MKFTTSYTKYFKLTKNINSNYSSILHVCINTQKGRVKLKNFRILLDSGYSYIIVMIRLIETLNPKNML